MTRRNTNGEVLGPGDGLDRFYHLDIHGREMRMEQQREPQPFSLYYSDEAVQLYHGDCLDVLPTLDAVDHVITDPPYSRDVYMRMNALNTKAGSGTLGRLGLRPTGTRQSQLKSEGTAIAKMAAGAIGDVNDLVFDVARYAATARRWVLVFSDVEFCSEWRAQLELAGLRYVRTGAWLKTDPMPQMSGDRPAVGFEPCTIAHAQGPMRWNGGGRAATWTYGTVKVNRPDHPCPKPEPLMSELVSLFTDPGDLILDPFAGSGTTGAAAKRLGRRCILIEKEERYAEVAAKRLSQGALELGFPNDSAVDPVGRGSSVRSRAMGFEFDGLS